MSPTPSRLPGGVALRDACVVANIGAACGPGRSFPRTIALLVPKRSQALPVMSGGTECTPRGLLCTYDEAPGPACGCTAPSLAFELGRKQTPLQWPQPRTAESLLMQVPRSEARCASDANGSFAEVPVERGSKGPREGDPGKQGHRSHWLSPLPQITALHR